MRDWTSLARGAEAGTKMATGIPIEAASPASEEPAFPVEETATRFTPIWAARARVRAEEPPSRQRVSYTAQVSQPIKEVT
jgi:hypothetical protein